jgi:Flp pilus assembly protein TadD
MGMLLQSEKKDEEAATNYLKAIELNPADTAAVYNLALVYLKLKHKDDVNATRDKLSQMHAPELLSDLDDKIVRSKINK